MKTHPRVMVKKFGGTSVGSLERIEAVADRLTSDLQSGEWPLVVASAMAGETNRLVRLASEVNEGSRGLAYDMLLASGEQVSIALLALALEKRGVRAWPLLAHQLGIKTDSIYSKAKIKSIDSAKLWRYIEQGLVPVVAGFQGVSSDDTITTLGRGGSDTTAVAIAAAMGLSACEIFTDVPAVFTADPRLVPRAREIPKITFDEMMEMASLGSRVLHFRSVELAAKYRVSIHLRSTFERRPGTWVVAEDKAMENPVVSAVTHDAGTVVFKISPVPPGPEFLARIFRELAERSLVVDIITQSELPEGQRLAFSVNDEDVLEARQTVQALLPPSAELQVMEKMAKVSVVGVGMRNHPGVAARFFGVLAREGVAPHLITTSDIKISAVVDRDRLERAALALHSEFHLDRE